MIDYLDLIGLTPRAGLEPATLRLTGGKGNGSRSLWRLAGRCRIEPPSLVESADFQPSLCAAACRHLLRFGAAKGQEKGNVGAHRSLGSIAHFIAATTESRSSSAPRLPQALALGT